jgi:hypothetical protein
MTSTLTSIPLAPLLDRLFDEAASLSPSTSLAVVAISPEELKLIESRLRPGSLIVADNADFSPDYLARVRSPANGYLSTAVGDDVEVSMKLG